MTGVTVNAAGSPPPMAREPWPDVVARCLDRPGIVGAHATRIVGRLARPDEDDVVRGLLERQEPKQVIRGRPLVSIVALLAGEVIGAASAWPGATADSAYAAVGVEARCRDIGVAAWLGHRLGHELRALGLDTIVPAPQRHGGDVERDGTTRT